jgi:hypothetical protein
MNWRVGLFRIWIILSVLWIGAWGYYGFTQWRGSTYEVTDPTGLKFEVNAPKDTPQADVVAFIQQSDVAKQRQADCSKERGPWCEFALSLQMPNKLNLSRVLLSAIAGPVALLFAGLAWFWIVSGFRQTAIKP